MMIPIGALVLDNQEDFGKKDVGDLVCECICLFAKKKVNKFVQQ